MTYIVKMNIDCAVWRTDGTYRSILIKLEHQFDRGKKSLIFGDLDPIFKVLGNIRMYRSVHIICLQTSY